ncbi:hypothetical protein [Streptomyces sp. TE33382]
MTTTRNPRSPAILRIHFHPAERNDTLYSQLLRSRPPGHQPVVEESRRHVELSAGPGRFSPPRFG